jgi:hypothetical protein
MRKYLEISALKQAASAFIQFFVSVTNLLATGGNLSSDGGGPIPHRQLTMPKSASSIFACEPEHIQAMHKAFDAVCATLELSSAAVDRVTELVALRIMKLARDGERDANRLTARTLAEFGVGTTDRCGAIRRRVRRREPV